MERSYSILNVLSKYKGERWLALFIVVPIVTCNFLLFSIILHKSLKESGLQYKVVETKPLKNFIGISLIIYNTLNSV